MTWMSSLIQFLPQNKIIFYYENYQIYTNVGCTRRPMYSSSSWIIIKILFNFVFGGNSIMVSNRIFFFSKDNGVLLLWDLLLLFYFNLSWYQKVIPPSSLCHPEWWGPAGKWMHSFQLGGFTAFMFGHSSTSIIVPMFPLLTRMENNSGKKLERWHPFNTAFWG